jgi:hypothetical protein
MGVIRTRARWPAGKPVFVRMDMPRWLGLSEISLQPQLPAGRPVGAGTTMSEDCATGLMWRLQQEQQQEVGSLSVGSTELVLNGQVLQQAGTCGLTLTANVLWPGKVNEVWSGAVRIPIEIVATCEEAIAPIASEAMNESMRAALGLSIRFEKGPIAANDGMLLWVGLDRAHHPELDAVAFGFLCDFRRRGESVQTCVLVPTPEVVTALSVGGNHGRADVPGLTRGRLTSGCTLEDWTVRVRGDAGAALLDWDRDHYWSGSFEVPLKELIRGD